MFRMDQSGRLCHIFSAVPLKIPQSQDKAVVNYPSFEKSSPGEKMARPESSRFGSTPIAKFLYFCSAVTGSNHCLTRIHAT